MPTQVSQKLSRILGLNMVVVGMVIGFSLLAAYAIPVYDEVSSTEQEGYLTFQSTCTACHQVDTVQNYQGSYSWPEIVDLMKGYGAFIREEEEQEIILYLEDAYPR